MPRNIIKRWIPDSDELRRHPLIRIFGSWLQDPALWHLNRSGVRSGVFIGIFVAFIPLPIQMILAALAAIVVRANLPIAIALVWITNPLTMAAIFYMAYKVGTILLGVPVEPMAFELSWEWLSSIFNTSWKPILLGCFVSGVAAGSVAAFTVDSLWRRWVLARWHLRKQKRLAKKKEEQ